MTRSSRPSASGAGLLTHHVFLDTEVYRQLGHNPENPLLKTLAEQISARGLELHTTDITFAEIRRQLREFVGKATQAVLTAKKQLGRWRHRHPEIVTQVITEIDTELVSQAAFDKLWLAARTEWGATHHEATKEPAAEIFDAYFRRFAPFAQQDSKEFPDAFVVKCLERWCVQNREKMYVVTADKAMTDAVKATSVLLPIRTLDDLLASVAATETPNIRNTAEKLLAQNRVLQSIQNAIAENIDDLIPIYTGGELPEAEVVGHEIAGEIEIVDFTVVAASAADVTLMMNIRTPLLIQVDYEDRSSAMYDNEDDVYFGAETDQAEIEDDPIIRVFAKIRRRPFGVHGLRILTNEVEVSEPYEDYR
jgi:hypothetical protein